jgi:ketosteroid isomerase-like protein
MTLRHKAFLASLAFALLPFAGVPTSAAAAEHGAAVRENVSPQARKDVLQAVEQWKKAVIAGDRAGLERAYHADLSYGHTDGAVLGKQAQIDRTLGGGASYPAIDIEDVAVRVYGNTALVTAKLAFHVSRDGKQSVSPLSGIDVWLKGSQGWQLVARQLTRPPAT